MIRHSQRNEMNSHMKEMLENAGVFYTEGYSDYLGSCGNSPVYVYDSNFILLVVLKKRGIFRFADLPVEYFKYGSAEDADPVAFLDECFAYLKTVLKLHWVNQPYTSARFKETPTNCIRIPYGNHIIDLNQAEEDIWNSFSSTNRNRIRKAEKSGVEIRFGGVELLDDFYKLHVETSIRSCFTPPDRSFFEEPFIHFPENVHVNVAYYDGKVQGANYCFCDKESCYDMYAASAYPSETGSGNLLVWRTVQRMRAENVRFYSLVGARINPDPESKYFSINQFKSRFAPDIDECFLFKVIFDMRRYKLYQKLKKLNTRLSRGTYTSDIIDQEIGKWIRMNDAAHLKALYGEEILKAAVTDRVEMTVT